jgi:hypothetical protein
MTRMVIGNRNERDIMLSYNNNIRVNSTHKNTNTPYVIHIHEIHDRFVDRPTDLPARLPG